MGDLGKRIATGIEKTAMGDPLEGALEVSPTAARSLAKAVDMASSGLYKDQNGRQVMDVDAYDALAKGIGFQPSSVAKRQERDSAVQAMVARVRQREDEIATKWARGFADKDEALKAQARAELLDWNEKNPSTPIKIRPQDVLKRAQKMRIDRSQRILDAAPQGGARRDGASSAATTRK